MFVKIYLLVGVLVIGNQLFGQEVHPSFQSIRQGISNNSIHCIIKDKRGFLWIGTQEGLNKYDGNSFVTYENNPNDSNSICHNAVNAIIEDSRGNIWIGTSDGLNLYNRVKDNFIRVQIPWRDNVYISSFCEDKNKNIWFGTMGIGIACINHDSGKINIYSHDKSDAKSITSNFITELHADLNNDLWIATWNGLDKFNEKDKSFTHFVHNPNDPSSISSNLVSSLTIDKNGNIWIGTFDGGLNKLTRDNKFKHYLSSSKSNTLTSNSILSLFADDKDHLWIGTENGGLNCLKISNDKFLKFQYEEKNASSLITNTIESIYIDDNDILWVGTYKKGIYYWDKKYQKFDLHSKNIFFENTLNDEDVTGFIEDPKGNIWIATDGGGISLFDPKNKKFKKTVSLTSNAVLAIIQESENIWAGTWKGGIDVINKEGKKIKSYKVEGVAKNGDNKVLSLYRDRQNNIWAGTAGSGLFLYSREKDMFLQFFDKNFPSQLRNDAIYVRHILQDSEDNIWVATLYGLNLLKRKKDNSFSYTSFHHRNDKKSISSDRVTFIFEDSKKNLWFGTEDKGINLFNKHDSSFTSFQKKHGLSNNSIKGILEDNKGNLWISTNKGISKFNPQEKTFLNYNKEDGLNSDEFYFNSCMKTKSGYFYFGGNNGFNVFNPDSIKENKLIPPVYLTDLKIFNKSVVIGAKGSPITKHISETEKIVLNHLQTSFTIDYVAINYTRGSKNQYAYILEGLEKDWNYVGNKTSATYTYVKPGTYKFKVKGSNNDEVWNQIPVVLEIVVKPPFWKTIWAYLLYTSVLAFLIISYLQLKISRTKQAHALKLERMEREKTEELNQMKQQFFTNISHELRTPLTLIIEPLKKLHLEKDSPEILGMVYRNSAKLKTLVDQILDFSKIENQMMKLIFTRKDVVEAIHLCISNFAEFTLQKSISLIFKSNIIKCVADIDEDKLDKILTNIVSNAIKNTPENGKITVALYYEDGNKIKIDITDTGQGISAADIEQIFDRFYTSANQVANNGCGIGLNLTKKLVELHDGKITVASIPGKSTVFSICLPLHVHELEFGQVEEYVTMQHFENKNRNWSVLPQFKYGKTILLIDDNSEMCHFIESILSDEFDVIKETNPLEGINHVIKYLPDLIISDVMMPGLNGFDLCKQIKSDVRFSHIPLILLTARATTSDTVTGLEIGADDYIHKPFEGKILKARVKNLILQKEKLRQHFIGTDGIINPKVVANKLDISFIDQVVDIIKEHYTDPEFNVLDIIEKIGMSRSIFYKKFKALSDISINDLVKNIRLKKAAELLSSRKMTVSEVAYNCGFNDPAYFTKVFKEFYKMSPREYNSNQHL